MQVLHDLRAIDPRLPYLLTAAVVGAVIWAWQQVHPKSFAQLPSQVKALPAAALGAILTASSSDNLNTLAVDLVFGAFAGVTAVGGHETLRRLVLPMAPAEAPLEAPASPVPAASPPPTYPAPLPRSVPLPPVPLPPAGPVDPESKGDI